MWQRIVGFLVTLTLSLLTVPLAINAQPRGKIPICIKLSWFV